MAKHHNDQVLDRSLKPTFRHRNIRLPPRAKRATGGSRVKEELFSGRPEVMDAGLAYYFGSIPMPSTRLIKIDIDGQEKWV
jgi:hypothetical protein